MSLQDYDDDDGDDANDIGYLFITFYFLTLVEMKMQLELIGRTLTWSGVWNRTIFKAPLVVLEIRQLVEWLGCVLDKSWNILKWPCNLTKDIVRNMEHFSCFPGLQSWQTILLMFKWSNEVTEKDTKFSHSFVCATNQNTMLVFLIQ